MKEIWLKPPETKNLPDSEAPHHRLSIKVDGEEIGEAELIYFSQPIRFYYLDTVWIRHDQRGKGLGSRAVEAVNEFLDKKGVPGMLLNVIEDERTRGIYERRGWKKNSSADVLVYSKKALSEKVLKEMEARFIRWFLRGHKKKEKAA